MRGLFLIHRYLGIALGLLMTLWCLSGVVMVYVAYPQLSENARLKGLTPIDFRRCCTLPDTALGDAERVVQFNVEMLHGDPVLRLALMGREPRLVNLVDGRVIAHVSAMEAASVASDYARARGYWDSPSLQQTIDYDQWTVSGEFDTDRPLYQFQFDDDARTELYVSSTTGKAVQVTTGSERFWNWLGAIPHWLYFAELRRNAHLWSRIIIYTSLLGSVLALIGIYIGVRQFVLRPAQRWSPYRRVLLWHHLPGLFFGVFALTWVASGLLSMNPWGFLESSDGGAERRELLGGPASGAQVKALLPALALRGANTEGVVSLESASLFARRYLLATDGEGSRRRLGPSGWDAPLTPAEIMQEAQLLARGARFSGPELLTHGDAYYFNRPLEKVSLPVYRIIVTDSESARYYLDPVSGALLERVGPKDREYRWLHDALHRLDFAATLRARPIWDIVLLLLLCGVTTVCATGTYLGIRRLSRRPAPRTTTPAA